MYYIFEYGITDHIMVKWYYEKPPLTVFVIFRKSLKSCCMHRNRCGNTRIQRGRGNLGSEFFEKLHRLQAVSDCVEDSQKTANGGFCFDWIHGKLLHRDRHGNLLCKPEKLPMVFFVAENLYNNVSSCSLVCAYRVYSERRKWGREFETEERKKKWGSEFETKERKKKRFSKSVFSRKKKKIEFFFYLQKKKGNIKK